MCKAWCKRSACLPGAAGRQILHISAGRKRGTSRKRCLQPSGQGVWHIEAGESSCSDIPCGQWSGECSGCSSNIINCWIIQQRKTTQSKDSPTWIHCTSAIAQTPFIRQLKDTKESDCNNHASLCSGVWATATNNRWRFTCFSCVSAGAAVSLIQLVPDYLC